MRILFLVLLSLSLAILGFKAVQHFSGWNLNQEEDYEWVEGVLTYISNVDLEESKTELDSPVIHLKIDTFKQYFSIHSGLEGGGQFLKNHPKLNKLEKGVKLALQIKKYKLRTLETGFVYASNPIVYGLAIEGEVLYSIQDFNRKIQAKNNRLGGIYLLAFILLSIVLILYSRKMRRKRNE